MVSIVFLPDLGMSKNCPLYLNETLSEDQNEYFITKGF